MREQVVSNFTLTPILQCGKHRLDLSRPKIMGILNLTPDSFSDGGRCFDAGRVSLDLSLKAAEQLLKEGADILDLGGESTRPGAAPVSEQEEMDRVLPALEAIVQRFDAVVSVDTSRPTLMREAAKLGASMLNDVRALQLDGAIEAAQATGLPVCLMHMQGQPTHMQKAPTYQNVVDEVLHFLNSRIDACIAAGIARNQLLIDPGFGFGKTLEHNLALLAHLNQLTVLQLPILVGLSRKSMLQHLLNRSVDERLPGSLALAHEALSRGATIIRVHDVGATRDLLTIYEQLTIFERLQAIEAE